MNTILNSITNLLLVMVCELLYVPNDFLTIGIVSDTF